MHTSPSQLAVALKGETDVHIKVASAAEPCRRCDANIAAAAALQLDSSTTIPEGTMTVIVCDGWITLEGEVDWWYQKMSAETCLEKNGRHQRNK